MSKCAQKSWMSCANGGGMRKFFGGKKGWFHNKASIMKSINNISELGGGGRMVHYI